jgi:hypothetical protein
VRCSWARKNCVLADCRFTAALGSAEELEASVREATVLLAAKTGPQAASSAAAKTGETRAKLLGEKKEEKKRLKQREARATHRPRTRAKFFRLNVMHNPPPQNRYFPKTANCLMLLEPLSRS